MPHIMQKMEVEFRGLIKAFSSDQRRLSVDFFDKNVVTQLGDKYGTR